ncbi:CoA-binding protein [Candidatus Roizmanbacteria bacterium RIFCSPLOWO2_02_FULL_37_19]|uniref:CoA-binding protein n=1 Tax=Candidatus Roizmanbacteria bacterium RIFCSPHIGHO2_02_FULL_37_24 TaxID=1802037 RepID=A0A1F7GZK2_9BACT|nr:MAG: CoA-binding protein [Candidatus Roizmanbacteria bacterium RIFCSPHIGHO2_02_FULL_37_24]OGK53648.1 MAG: CoA-binding protein [Candidatus Roizmanbacteria bacterium RIFCSPLOWO2_02_FULL_37_19]OGK60194.1 MAG: CoA-binding protein [Candidatus Roizmanbacteria bacterium RIFCSPLOWO2_12_FULL_37_7b]
MDSQSIFNTTNIIAIVGLSDKSDRPSYEVGEYLHTHGFKIIPVNPHIESVFGLKSYPSLLDISEKIDVVDIFRKPEFVPDIVDQAIQIGAKAIWMQEGISHPEATKKAREYGLYVVENACMMKVHKKLNKEF